MMYDYKLHLTIRTPRACPWEQSAEYRYYIEPGVDTLGGEEFTAYKLKTCKKDRNAEDISLYGVSENSRFLDKETVRKIDKGKVLVSTSMAEKYGIEKGDSFKLKECYDSKKHSFTSGGIIDQPEGLSLYMSKNKLNKIMGKSPDYYNGCYSNKKLKIPEEKIVSIVTEENLQKTTRQLTLSMEGFFVIMKIVSVVIYILVIYLLSKEVIEKSRKDISMVKILGYEDREIKRLYIVPARIVFVLSLIINMPIGTKLAELSISSAMKSVNGWLSFHVPQDTYIKLFVVGTVTYFLVEQVIFQKVKKISMSETLSEQ